MKKPLWLVLLMATIVVAYFAFDLNHRLTIEGIKGSLGDLHAWRERSPVALTLVYFCVYVIAAALSLPGAAVLTLAAGAIFGLIWGTILVSFASSLGALLAFLVARYLLRDAVQSRFGDRVKIINEGIARDGALYLFTLRLIPAFPFFAVNLLMGLTAMRAFTFLWASQIGMLAWTFVFVNIGTQLATLTSSTHFFSARLVLSAAALAALPWTAKRLLESWRKRRLYARWRQPKRFDRNLIVIGAGAGGLVTAYIAAAVKAKVTLVESHKMGGDCLNYGCVPSKTLIKSAKVAHHTRHGDHYGMEAIEPRFSFRQVMARVEDIIRTVAPHDSAERYTNLGVEVLAGYARLIDPWTVDVKLNDGGSRRLTTRSIVIATGASPLVPQLPGIEDSGYVTSDTLWEAFAKLDSAPGRIIVLGGGPIGSELAQAFARLGSQVTQIERATRILSREDEEVSNAARIALEADCVRVLTGHEALRCERQGETRVLVVQHEGEVRTIPYDALICAVGRVARLANYGLEELGVPAQHTVGTNEYLETLYPNIFAAGDVAGPYQFTHFAGHQAWYAAVNALFGNVRKFKVDYRVIPRVTFVDPEIARVGLNEQEAKVQGVAYEVTRYNLEELDRALAEGAGQGFVKVLTVPGKDRILGVTIVGEQAGELLAEFVLAMKWKLGLKKILSTIHTYPTLAEANKYVAGEWQRAHTPRRIMSLLERYHTWRRG